MLLISVEIRQSFVTILFHCELFINKFNNFRSYNSYITSPVLNFYALCFYCSKPGNGRGGRAGPLDYAFGVSSVKEHSLYCKQRVFSFNTKDIGAKKNFSCNGIFLLYTWNPHKYLYAECRTVIKPGTSLIILKRFYCECLDSSTNHFSYF